MATKGTTEVTAEHYTLLVRKMVSERMHLAHWEAATMAADENELGIFEEQKALALKADKENKRLAREIKKLGG